MKKVRQLQKFIQREVKSEPGQPNLLFFCDKSTPLAQFQADPHPDENCVVERMAGMLAVQCLIRGSEPADFSILVPAERSFTNRLVSRAQTLLDEGRTTAHPTALSARQKEILHSVIRNRANKEIASKLNITVRTVKFHISTLLSKFGVENRVELARKAVGVLTPDGSLEAPLSFDTVDPAPEVPRRREFRTVTFDNLHVGKNGHSPFRDRLPA